MKFKVGQILILHPITRTYGAEFGARCKCLGYIKEYVDVKWIRNNLAHEQSDGCYNEDDFVVDKSKIIKTYGIVKFMEKINNV